LGDVLSLLYLCSATLKRYEAEGRQQADAPLMHWAIQDAMVKAQSAFEGVLSNFPNRFLSGMMRRLVFPLGRPCVVPSDALGHDIAKLLLEPSAARDRLTAGMFLGSPDDEGVGLIERALAATLASEPVEAKIRRAVKEHSLDGKLPAGAGLEVLVTRAQAAGVISAAEGERVLAARDLTARVIRVDDFAQDLGASEMRLVATAPAAAVPAPAIVHKAAA
jgi:acyl-CoA dehydrogenase